MSDKSEFGKGLVVCLLHFANHWSNDQMQGIWELERARRDKKPVPQKWVSSLNIYGNIEDLISSKITTWANGATDHLYEMEVPKGTRWSSVAHKVELLKNEGLEMGHGFTGRKYTADDMDSIIKRSKDIAFEIDKLIGLDPDLGEWQ
jgi:hypothetical protein